jgi:hypothetical protein
MDINFISHNYNEPLNIISFHIYYTNLIDIDMFLIVGNDFIA